MRVRKPMRNCAIVVMQCDTVVRSKKMRKALPAEMIQLKIKKDDLKSSNHIKVVVIHE